MNSHQSYTLASRPQNPPGPARLGGAFRAAFLRRDLPDRRRPDRRRCPYHRHRLLPDRPALSRRASPPSPRSAFWRRASSRSPTCSAAIPLPNFSASNRTPGAPSNCGNVDAHRLLISASCAGSRQYRRGWIVLFYITTLAALIVLATSSSASRRWRARGLLSAQRIFLIGTGENVGRLRQPFEPWALASTSSAAAF